MRAVLISLFLASACAANVSAAPTPSQKKAPASLCKAPEQVIFDCQIEERSASVCRSDQVITFRFRSSDNHDIQVTSDGKDGRIHQFHLRGGQGGFSRGLRFSQDGMEFLPFISMAGALTDVPGLLSSGVEIQKNHVSLATHQCKVTKGKDMSIPDFVPEETDKRYLVWY